MTAANLYAYFKTVEEEEALEMGRGAEEMFARKNALAKDLNQDPTFYFSMNLSAKSKLLALLNAEEKRFWRRVEAAMRLFLRRISLKDLRKTSPESFAGMEGSITRIINARAIVGQIRQNVTEQTTYLEEINSKEDFQPIKVFNQKFNEQKKLYQELMENNSEAMREAAKCAKIAMEGLKALHKKGIKDEELGICLKSVGYFFMGFSVFGGIDSVWNMQGLQEINGQIEQFVKMLLIFGAPSAIVAMIGADFEKKANELRELLSNA
jgi:hypothetical protein